MTINDAFWCLGVLLLVIAYNSKNNDRVQLWSGLSVLWIFVYYNLKDVEHYADYLAFIWVALEIYKQYQKMNTNANKQKQPNQPNQINKINKKKKDTFWH